MDKMSLLGMIVSVVCIMASFLMEHGELAWLVNIPSLIVVLGCTAGAVMLSFTPKEMKAFGTLFKKIMKQGPSDYEALINQFFDLATQAKREGLLSLESKMDSIDDTFIKNGVQLLIDNKDKHYIQEKLEIEISAMEDRHSRGAGIFLSAGAFCPTMGIMGTVMHMLVIMRNLDDPASLGPSISAAFTATLYGVAFANVFFFPFAEKLKGKTKEEVLYRSISMEGIIAIADGTSAADVKEKLTAFLTEKQKSIFGSEESKGA